MPTDGLEDAKLKLTLVAVIVAATVSGTIWIASWVLKVELAHKDVHNEIEQVHLMLKKIDGRIDSVVAERTDSRWRRTDMIIWAAELSRANQSLHVPTVTERAPTSPSWDSMPDYSERLKN